MLAAEKGKGALMRFLKKLIGLDGRPDELRDGALEDIVRQETRPVIAEFYSNT
jgi:hypothetical protein